MRARTVVLLAAAIAAGAAVEWLAYDAALGPALAAADLAVGCVLLICGAIAWDRRPESRVGAVMGLSGATWFLGTAVARLAALHRGPLVQLYLSYPGGRIRSRLVRAVVAAAYVDGAIQPLARNDTVTLVLAAAVAGVAIDGFVRASGAARPARRPALAAALAYAGALALGVVEGSRDYRAVLWVYDVVIVTTVVVLVVDLLRSRWHEAVVTGLVVDLGAAAETGTLRAKLARALGDPSLVVGYRLARLDTFVDDAGRQVQLPAAGSDRTVTPLVDRGERIGVLIHDGALKVDERLLGSVAAAARIALANAALQSEARAKEDELDASRRRIVEAGDAQRRRIRRELQRGAGDDLHRVAAHIADVRQRLRTSDSAALAGLERELAEARDALDEFAQGVMPPTLTDDGLVPALAQLAERSAIPVELIGDFGRLSPSLEAAFYFVCSEALANVGKHAGASRATIELKAAPGRLSVTIADDGIGGADPSAGSGLRGLADRVEALGGHLDVGSPSGGGTRVAAWIATEGQPVRVSGAAKSPK
jgi:signal transduction histidine kinase